jgi:hypothetical protein
LLSIRSRHRVSTFLPPFAPPALPGFSATMGALTPARGRGFLVLAQAPCSLPRRSPHVTCLAFQALRLQPPLRSLDRFGTYPQRPGLPRSSRGLGFAFPSQARQSDRPNRVRHPTDCSFASGCSPPVGPSLAVQPRLAACRTYRDPASGLESQRRFASRMPLPHEQLPPHRPADRFPDATVSG